MAFDSSHWYTRAGAPCYEQVTAKGGTRNTDLRDARKIGLVPSVTTVLQVIDKPALVNWKVKQGILAALTLPRVDGETEDTWLSRIMSDSSEQVTAAAEEGTRIHNAIEDSFLARAVPTQYQAHVEATRAEIARLYPSVNDWVAEASFASQLGYGGKVDLHSPSTGIVIDYKGKDGDFTDGKKLAYDQHYQLAAYQYGLGLPVTESANIFVSRTHPGSVVSHVWTPAQMMDGSAVFMATLTLWQAVKRFDSSYEVV